MIRSKIFMLCDCSGQAQETRAGLVRLATRLVATIAANITTKAQVGNVCYVQICVVQMCIIIMWSTFPLITVIQWEIKGIRVTAN